MDRKKFRTIIEDVLVDNYVDNIEGLSEELIARLNDEFLAVHFVHPPDRL